MPTSYARRSDAFKPDVSWCGIPLAEAMIDLARSRAYHGPNAMKQA